MAQLNSLADNI